MFHGAWKGPFKLRRSLSSGETHGVSAALGQKLGQGSPLVVPCPSSDTTYSGWVLEELIESCYTWVINSQASGLRVSDLSRGTP